MKIKPEELEKLGELLVSTYRAKELMVTKADDALIKKKIAEIIAHNFAEEEAIEEEARKMLAAHAPGDAGHGFLQNVSARQAKTRGEKGLHSMNRLSENRISHLAHLVLDGLRKAKLAEFPNEGRSLTETKLVLQ